MNSWIPPALEPINPSLQTIYQEQGTVLNAFHILCVLVLTALHEIAFLSLPYSHGQELYKYISYAKLKSFPLALMKRHLYLPIRKQEADMSFHYQHLLPQLCSYRKILHAGEKYEIQINNMDKDISRHDFITKMSAKFNEKTHSWGKMKMSQTLCIQCVEMIKLPQTFFFCSQHVNNKNVLDLCYVICVGNN